MATTLSQKLKIKAAFTLLTFNAPYDFQKTLIPLPADVKISDAAKKLQSGALVCEEQSPNGKRVE